MGSASTKEVGTEVIEQENSTQGGFHVFEVVKNQRDYDNNWRGFKNDLSYYCNYIIPSHQIHGKTATFGVVTLAVIGIVVYTAWRFCRRRWQQERAINMEAFHLHQPPTVRVPIFGPATEQRRNYEAPPTYPVVGQDAPPRYDVEKCMASLP